MRKKNSELSEDFRDIWEDGSRCYAHRVSRYGYAIVEPGADGQDYAVIIECESAVYDVVIQKLIDKGHVVDSGRWKDDECLDCPVGKEKRTVVEKCPKCDAMTYNYEGFIGGVSWNCETCGWGCATSCFPPCYGDDERYRLIWEAETNESLIRISAVGKLFHVHYHKILVDLRAGKPFEFYGSLREITGKMKALDSMGIAYRIEPPLPYSMIFDCIGKGYL